MAEANTTPQPRGAGWRSRKLWFALLVLAAAVALLVTRHIGEATWLSITTVCVYGYMGGNVGTGLADGLSKMLAAVLARPPAERQP